MAKTYKIGEAAELLELKSYVLRFWETEFPQLVPLRTAKGQRIYTENMLALLRQIKMLLHEQGMTIDGARRILESASTQAVTSTGAPRAHAEKKTAIAKPTANSQGSLLPQPEAYETTTEQDTMRFLASIAGELREIRTLLRCPRNSATTFPA